MLLLLLLLMMVMIWGVPRRGCVLRSVVRFITCVWRISSCRRVAGFPSEIPLFVAISLPGVLIEAVIKVICDVSTWFQPRFIGDFIEVVRVDAHTIDGPLCL